MVRLGREQGLLDAGGGHAMAAGFSLHADKLERWNAFLSAQFAGLDTMVAAASDLDLDAIVSPSGATVELVDDIARAGPFGAASPEPHFIVPDVAVGFADMVGGDHVRLGLVGADGARLNAIAFRCGSTALGQGLLGARGRKIHAAGRLKIDEWQGRTRVQLQLEDAAPASA
jgi:single-stranded-DNA-specific exonuclease